LADPELFGSEKDFWKTKTSYFVAHNDKTEIIVPSYGAVGALFARHYGTLD
jgi:hypothetical protein